MKKVYLAIFLVVTVILTATSLSATNNTSDTTQIVQDTSNSTSIDEEIIADNDDTNKSLKTVETQTRNYSNGTYELDPETIDYNLTIIGESKENTILTTSSEESLFTITSNGSLTLINVTIANHLSYNSSTIVNDGTLILENTEFKNNSNANNTTVSNGGATYNRGLLEIYNSTFSNNYGYMGASIYALNANTVIYNSAFTNDKTFNVGGSIYSRNSNLSIYNSTFSLNDAVSGAGIYNAAGNLTIEDSLFNRNNASTYYGGAIYSTGTTNVKNTQFQYNRAQYSGGAITNTADFTAINCTFNGNYAGTDGGVIENIPWTETENGQVTLINSTFTDNSAVENGGVIANLNTSSVEDNNGKVTATGCVFESNSATQGGAIYSYTNQEIDIEYCVFSSNSADIYNVIYSDNNDIISIENNWWGENNPNWTRVGVTPEKWYVMTYTNTTALVDNLETNLHVTLNTLNTGETPEGGLPSREVIFMGNTTYSNNFISFTDYVEVTCIAEYGANITARIDDERITLTPILADITDSLSQENQTLNINMTIADETINGKASIKINGKTIINNTDVVNGTLNLEYDIPVDWNKDTYTMTVVMRTDDDMVMRKNTTITLGEREVTAQIEVVSDGSIQTGDTIEIIAKLSTGNKSIETGRVAFKINGKTIATNINVVNGEARINYTIDYSFSAKDYNLSIVYSGDGNKAKITSDTNLTIQKQDVHLYTDSTMEYVSEAGISIRMILLDTNNNTVTKGKVCYKINGITINTNITLEDGVFYFDYVTPIVEPDQTLSQTLTVKMGENNKYNLFSIDIPITILG